MYKEISKEIRTKVHTDWNTSLSQLYFDNLPRGTTPKGDIWVRLTVDFGDENVSTFGSSTITGVATFQVFYKKDTGSTGMDEVLDSIRSKFSDIVLPTNSIRLMRPVVAGKRYDGADYNQINVNLNFNKIT